MFSYLKHLCLFIIFFISFHFTYNYIKGLFSNKKKEIEVFEPIKYNSVLNEINEILEKNSNNKINLDSSFNKHEPHNTQCSIIETQSLEEELENYMKETEKEVLTLNNTIIKKPIEQLNL